jgi:cell division protein FtsB
MLKNIIVKTFTNKYFLTAFAFVLWTAFFDQNDWLTMQQRQKELNNVKSNIAYLTNEVNRMNKEKTELQNDPVMLERYARENYRMRHEGEDVYVIEKK